MVQHMYRVMYREQQSVVTDRGYSSGTRTRGVHPSHEPRSRNRESRKGIAVMIQKAEAARDRDHASALAGATETSSGFGSDLAKTGSSFIVW